MDHFGSINIPRDPPYFLPMAAPLQGDEALLRAGRSGQGLCGEGLEGRGLRSAGDLAKLEQRMNLILFRIRSTGVESHSSRRHIYISIYIYIYVCK